MNCTDEEYPYMSFENTTTTVMADTVDCRVEKRAVCKPRTSNKCASITFTTCTEEPVASCEEKPVPCPHKEKLHKQWCLFDRDHQNHRHQDNELDDVFDLREVEEEGK